MTFMLGAFTQGLSQGAKDIYGLENANANTDATRAHTAQQKQETQMAKDASDAAKALTLNASAPQPVPQAALNVTPSNSGPAGGGVGTTTNGPVAPLNFATAVPQPAFMPQSAPGSASGYGPSYNPEAGPAAASQQQGPAIGNAPLMPSAPTLASGSDRTSPTGPGGAAPVAAPTQGLSMTEPLLKQNLDLNTPILQQLIPSLNPHSPAAAPLPTRAGALDGTVHNRPVGAAIKDWWNGTSTPDQPTKHASKGAQTSSNNLGRKMASVLNVG